ncbi:ER membrane protein complex subunit 8/9 homolog isoform X2 [Hylaeus volcanicus]|uniref:ER membrane protein complex subunit 8/9 homolog isoform X2 n=1 Tax=Hylaeus volcanicus TaxID=313075 RepID=UPI0023B78D0D|nr:ER membrane protein complex subunit 8/9 homolog isoform X2 [Hylaeus volcanicus]
MEQSTSSNTSLTVFVKTQAYSSMMCHTFKNPLTSVVGVLLGQIEETKAICFLSFSLLHSQTINTPLLGLGFSAAEKIGRQNNLTIIGMYFSNEDNSLRLLPWQNTIISQLVFKGIKNPIILMVKNSTTTSVDIEKGACQKVSDQISHGEHLTTYDLYDHVHNITSIPG